MLRPLRFLLIDAGDGLVAAVQQSLAEAKACIIAARCDHAIELLESEPFDCVLLGACMSRECRQSLRPALVSRQLPVVLVANGHVPDDVLAELDEVAIDVLNANDLTAENLCQMMARANKFTDLRRKLAHTEVRLDQALTAAQVGIFDWDMTTDDVYVSPQLTDQLGYGPNETWQGLDDWKNSLHPDDREAAIARVQDYIDGRTATYASTFRLAHRDGTYRWILSQGRVVRDAAGTPLRFIGVHIDITERKQNEDELARSYLELRQLAHAAAHDLQEPLRAITRYSQLLIRKIGTTLPEPVQGWLRIIVAAASRQQSLIEDLTTYTALESETTPLVEVCCQDLVQSVCGTLDADIRKAGASVTIGKLPTLRAHPRRMAVLFECLIRNALQFHHAERPPHIEVQAEHQAPDGWRFCVSDNGIGIAAEHRQVIFDVFRRLHHQDQHCGNGIGLSLCRRIVERLGGNIWVESTLGAGSRFCFTIPADPSRRVRTSK